MPGRKQKDMPRSTGRQFKFASFSDIIRRIRAPGLCPTGRTWPEASQPSCIVTDLSGGISGAVCLAGDQLRQFRFIEDMIGKYLVHSYLYYIMDRTVICDAEYDQICKILYENFDNLPDHPHKRLLDRDALRAGSGYHLKDEDYPLIVKNIAGRLYAGQDI